jgi:hypothetical protein
MSRRHARFCRCGRLCTTKSPRCKTCRTWRRRESLRMAAERSALRRKPEPTRIVEALFVLADAARRRARTMRWNSLTSVHAGRPGLVSENAGPSCENSTSPGLSSGERA